MSKLRVLKRLRCPACKRNVQPGRRHRERDRNPSSAWCSGKADPVHERRMRKFVHVSKGLSLLAMDGHEELVEAICDVVLERFGAQIPDESPVRG